MKGLFEVTLLTERLYKMIVASGDEVRLRRESRWVGEESNAMA